MMCVKLSTYNVIRCIAHTGHSTVMVNICVKVFALDYANVRVLNDNVPLRRPI